ncbi:tetratricopeptide repeat protein [Synechococcus sp. HIMB2401]|uniref:tetratricopeptide repeat protein n=1 Tax=Synechococcus sp. HIMB2401 TaxID=3144208 RepID=UPI0036F35D4A
MAAELIKLNRIDDARIIYQELIQSGLATYLSYANLAMIYAQRNQVKKSLLLVLKALQINQNSSDAYNTLASLLKKRGRYLDAICCYKAAIKLDPESLVFFSNLGYAYHENGMIDNAINSYRKAVLLRPECPDLQMDLALAELLASNCSKGWERFEYRLQCQRDLGIPEAKSCWSRWTGQQLPYGKELFLIGEQGLGDTLQFMRYVLPLRMAGITTRICANEQLHSVIKSSGIDHAPVTPGQVEGMTGITWVPLLSVPGLLGVTPNNPIVDKPYIVPDQILLRKWRAIMSNERRPIVAINWKGNPKAEKSGMLFGRSLDLECFEVLAKTLDLTLVSLQKGVNSDQVKSCSFSKRFVGFQSQVDEAMDLGETAAVIANCDLVITCDTSVAHLSGGMGKLTYLLLHKSSDWRWGTESNRTFWYDSVRLFRQQELGSWELPMLKVASEIVHCFK